jgi:hypothetical protein
MVSHQRSFHLIECPTGVSSSHACLVVNGRGVPHESLTVFYEELQKRDGVPARDAALQSMLSFFSFLEQPDQGVETAASPHEPCSSRPYALKRSELPEAAYWAGPPSEIKLTIRAYLFARWGCLTSSSSPDEEMVLSPSAKATGEMRRFLAVLRQFYRFAIERQDYWYDGNPVTAFRIPLRSRIRQVIAPISFTLPSRPALHQSRIDEGGREELVQSISPFSPHLEQPLPVVLDEAWGQLVPEHVKS